VTVRCHSCHLSLALHGNRHAPMPEWMEEDKEDSCLPDRSSIRDPIGERKDLSRLCVLSDRALSPPNTPMFAPKYPAL